MIRRRALCAAFLTIALFESPVTRADEIDFEGANIRFTVPDGYCALRSTDSKERRFHELIQEIQGKQNTVLSLFIACHQLQPFYDTGAVRDYGIILGGRDAAKDEPYRLGSMTRAAFVELMAGVVSKQTANESFATIGTKLKQVGAKFQSEISTKGGNIGVLERTEDALYLAIAMNMISNGREKAIAGVSGITAVSDRLLTFNMYATYTGENLYPALLEKTKTGIQAMLDQNAPPAELPVTPVRSAATSDPLPEWGQILTLALASTLIGALLFAIGYQLRRRSKAPCSRSVNVRQPPS